LYGIGFVTLINTSSLVGAVLIPFANKSFYKKLLMFLIALAVGTLAGSGFLHLIPQAHGIVDDDAYNLNHAYVWKGVVIMGGVYLFYVVEKILKLFILKKNMQRKKPKRDVSQDAFDSLESYGYVKTHEQNVEPNVEMRTKLNRIPNDKQQSNDLFISSHVGHSHFINDNDNLDDDNNSSKLTKIAPVAWMIIFGDGLHNFIDGLSIGAAFCESPLKGISICIAVICEEFPHELGDFAILINSGMSFKMALLFNFLSACACYVGLFIGISIGEDPETNKWIYAVAGGMFIYIALCDMIPELNQSGEDIEKDYFKQLKKKHAALQMSNTSKQDNNQIEPDFNAKRFSFKIKVLLTQNFGILIGFALMLVMSLFSDRIEL
jgi:zinc transporter ZupT